MFKCDKMKLLIFNILLFSFSSIVLFTKAQQDTSNDIEQFLFENNLENVLLPLDNLLDSAQRYSPLLKIINSDIIIQELILKSEKNEWMSYFNVNGSVKYGRFDNLILSQDMGIEDAVVPTSAQIRYSLGLLFNIPFESFLDKSDKQIAKNEVIKLGYERDKTITELRKLVILQYGNLLRAHKRLIIKASELESEKMQMMDTELNYKNGLLTLSDYTNQKGVLLNLHLTYEEAKIEFITATNLLQEIVGIKLNLNIKN
jgi:outer membrane protein TolC